MDAINKLKKVVANQRKSTVAPAAVFTRRELEILQLLADGLGSEQIGKKLYLSVFTVKTHRRNMQSRIQCRNAAALISYAFRKGLVR